MYILFNTEKRLKIYDQALFVVIDQNQPVYDEG